VFRVVQADLPGPYRAMSLKDFLFESRQTGESNPYGWVDSPLLTGDQAASFCHHLKLVSLVMPGQEKDVEAAARAIFGKNADSERCAVNAEFGQRNQFGKERLRLFTYTQPLSVVAVLEEVEAVLENWATRESPKLGACVRASVSQSVCHSMSEIKLLPPGLLIEQKPAFDYHTHRTLWMVGENCMSLR